MAIAIRRGAPKPDVRTVGALKASLLASKSIAFAKEGSGGVYLMGLLKRLGLIEPMTPKFKPVTTGDDVSQAVSRGEAELGRAAVERDPAGAGSRAAPSRRTSRTTP